ncbi:hypothetical protein Tco_1008048, partial [Tanacetum coccineum]
PTLGGDNLVMPIAMIGLQDIIDLWMPVHSEVSLLLDSVSGDEGVDSDYLLSQKGKNRNVDLSQTHPPRGQLGKPPFQPTITSIPIMIPDYKVWVHGYK